MSNFFDFYPPRHFDNFFLNNRLPFLCFGVALTLFILYCPKLDRKKIENISITLQAFIIAGLNVWYFASHYRWLTESLPLYHCRIFMWGLVICHYLKLHQSKMFFAVGGLLGSTIAFAVPETDPFNFPHITIISFMFGHLLLFINSLLTIKIHYRKLKIGEITIKVSLISLIMYIANCFFHGNYGFMRIPPRILAPLADKYMPFYPVSLTLLLILTVWLMNELIYQIKKRQNPSL